MWKPVEYVEDNGFSVCLLDPKSNLHFWIDVWIDEDYHDVECDWNQYLFYTDSEEDILRRDIQNDCDNFDDASSSAICFLEEQGVIYQDEKANWFVRRN